MRPRNNGIHSLLFFFCFSSFAFLGRFHSLLCAVSQAANYLVEPLVEHPAVRRKGQVSHVSMYIMVLYTALNPRLYLSASVVVIEALPTIP
jgi:hypothetical protein